MRDRTEEFKNTNPFRASASQDSFNSSVTLNQMQDIELGVIGNNHEEWMNNFFNEINSIQSLLAQLEANLPKIERTQGSILSSISDHEQNLKRKELDELMDSCEILSSNIRDKLKKLEKGANQNLSSGTADHRMVVSQNLSLVKKLRNVIYNYQEIQKNYREKQKMRFERQYRIVNPNATEGEISKVLDENYQGPIFAQNILNSTLVEDAKKVLKEVQIRHDEIVNLAKSINELQKLFIDLSTLISQQDDLVNQISYQMSNVAAYTGQANETLEKAIGSAQKARRRNFCLMFLCFILIALLVLIIIFVILPKVGVKVVQ